MVSGTILTPFPQCQNDSESVYEYYTGGPSNYGVPDSPAVDWQPENKCRLENYLLNTSVVNGCN